jgi:4-coumarate--CoA ligase
MYRSEMVLALTL